MAITSLDQLDPNGSYTYADYLLWQFTERVELLRGHIRQMAAPNRKHQGISQHLSRFFGERTLANPLQGVCGPVRRATDAV